MAKKTKKRAEKRASKPGKKTAKGAKKTAKGTKLKKAAKARSKGSGSSKRGRSPLAKRAVKPREPRVKKQLPSGYFDPKAYARKRAAVLGLGRSGFYAARLLAKKGCKVLVSDSRPRKDIRSLASRLPAGVSWEGGGHSDRLLKCHFAVKSPGIPSHAPVLARLREAGIPVFSELEVAYAFAKPCVTAAVTGSNGKSTTASLAAAVFRAARRRTHLFGNIGEALSGGVSKIKKGDTLVLEVSSYQLEDSRRFLPDAAAVLNVTREHLEHHGTMEAYMAAKARIFHHQGRNQSCVFNADDSLTLRLARACRATKLFFGRAPSTRICAWLEKGRIMLKLPGAKKAAALAPPKLPGEHNLENAMAAALLTASLGVTPAAIAKGFRSFKGVEHRIETVGRFRGLDCINDSKATNVDSALAALRSLEGKAGPILLILGGLHKGGGFKALRPYVDRCVKAVLTIGSAAPTIEEDLQGAAHVFPCETLEQAVAVAFQIGQKGETLLLSPACASFDQFADFEARGARFKELVRGSGKVR